MPEGDTIHRAANRVRALIADRVPVIATPNVRKNADRWPQRLDGQRVTAVDAHGKHLFIRFEGGLAIHSHLRMTGAWGAYRPDQRWGRSAKRAWLTLRTDDGVAVQFGGPLLELLTDARARSQVQQQLGPDILAPQLDEQRIMRRLREDDPTRPFGDALLDQSTVAGIGNIWKSEGCHAAGLAPWRATSAVSDDEALTVLRATAKLMAQAVDGGIRHRQHAVYRRSGRPCPRCGGAIVSRGQGDDNRTTYWCTGCQT